MKPQIVGELSGFHNRDLKASAARLIKGDSWRKNRIIVILPAAASIPSKVALSHWNLIFPPNNGVLRLLAQGMEVGEAYSSVIEQIMQHPELSKWEYILTIEHDNIPPQDGILRLVEKMNTYPKLDVISGLYFTKGEGGVAQIWGDKSDPVVNFRPQVPVPGQLVECYGTGMGFALWRLKIFKDEKLRKPWFKTETKNGVASQDLYFWVDAQKHGYRCAVDCSIPVGHYDVDTDMVW